MNVWKMRIEIRKTEQLAETTSLIDAGSYKFSLPAAIVDLITNYFFE